MVSSTETSAIFFCPRNGIEHEAQYHVKRCDTGLFETQNSKFQNRLRKIRARFSALLTFYNIDKPPQAIYIVIVVRTLD